MVAVLIRIDGNDPAAGSAVTLRASSHDDPAVCHLGGETWWPAIATRPKLRYDLFDGDFGGAVTAPSSQLTLAIEPFPDLPRWALADGRFRLWTGEVGADWADWTLRFDGRVTEDPPIANGMATIGFAADDRWMDEPLLDVFAGTGGAEGEAGLKGTVKPLALGKPRYVSGVLVDPIDTIVQVSATPLHAVTAAMEKLNRFGAAYADYADFAALKAATVPAGRWATSLATGYVKHGAPLTGQQSYMVEGDYAGDDGWVRLPGAVIKRIAALAGAAGRVNDASLAVLDAARPWPISLYLSGSQVTPRDLIQRIAASVNAVAGLDWLGRLFVVPVDFGLFATAELRSDGTTLPPVGDVSQAGSGAPWWRIAIESERAWTVHGPADVAFTAVLNERGLYDGAESYREGDIVSLADGSRWLYVNPTPTTGNDPPVGTGGDAYWASLSPAIDPVEIGLEPGATRNVERGEWAGGVDYLTGDFVSWEGKRYRAVENHISDAGDPPPNADWAYVGEQVDDGSVDTGKVSTNAITAVSIANFALVDPLTPGGQVFADLTVGSVPAGATCVKVTGTATVRDNTSPPPYTAYFLIRLRRTAPGGSPVIVKSITNFYEYECTVNLTYYDTAPVAGTVYDLYFDDQTDPGPSDCQAYQIQMAAEYFKR